MRILLETAILRCHTPHRHVDKDNARLEQFIYKKSLQ